MPDPATTYVNVTGQMPPGYTGTTTNVSGQTLYRDKYGNYTQGSSDSDDDPVELSPGGAAAPRPSAPQLPSPNIQPIQPQQAPQQVSQPQVNPVSLSPSQSLSAIVSGGGTEVLINHVIAREGGSPAGVVNNPGNIKFTGAPGQVNSGVPATDGGTFASYQTPEAGRQAIAGIIQKASSGGSGPYGANPTVNSFLQTYEGKGGTLRSQWMQLTPEERQNQQQFRDEVARIQAGSIPILYEYARQINSAPEGSQQRQQLIDELRAEMSERRRQWEEKVANPPVATPQDAWKNMGNPGFILAALAGLLSRQHMTAGLTAAGAALNAINKGSREEFERQYNIWKDQVELGSQMIKMDNEEIRSIIDDQKMAVDEKNSRLQQLGTYLGLQTVVGKMGLEPIEQYGRYLETMGKAQRAFELGQQKIEAMAAARAPKPEQFRYKPKDGPPQVINYNPVTHTATDLRGNPIDLPSDADLVPLKQAVTGGGREASQIQSMLGVTSEAARDLRNMMELPIGANEGMFMGVQQSNPRELGEAWKRSLANRLTKEDSIDVITTAQGIQREIATIEAQGRATGLVGLTAMSDELIPKVGDTGENVLRKMAQIRQIMEANAEVILAKSGLDKGLREKLEADVAAIQKSVPFTVHEVNEMWRLTRAGAPPETIAEYANRALSKQAAPPSDLPNPSGLAEGTIARDKQTGKQWIIRSGKWEQSGG